MLKRRVIPILSFAALTVLVMLCGCAKNSVPVSIERGEKWELFSRSGLFSTEYSYTLYSHYDGTAIYSSEWKGERPALHDIGWDCVAVGNENASRYVDTYDGRVSERFERIIAEGDECRMIACLCGENSGDAFISVCNPFYPDDAKRFDLPFSPDTDIGELVCGAVFDEYCTELTVIYLSGEEKRQTAAVLPLDTLDWENNPIDRFHDQWMVYGGSTLSDKLAAAMYCELWETELNHAFELLSERANYDVALQSAADAQEAFFDAADKIAVMEGYCEWSDAFGEESYGYDGAYPLCGTGMGEGVAYSRAELCRAETLRIYRMMDVCFRCFESVDEPFLFDAESYYSEIFESGLIIEERTAG